MLRPIAMEPRTSRKAPRDEIGSRSGGWKTYGDGTTYRAKQTIKVRWKSRALVLNIAFGDRVFRN